MIDFLTSTWGIVVIVAVGISLFLLLSLVLYRPIFKRFFDIVLSLIGIILFLPLLLLLIVVGAIKMHGNPFFTQERPGKNEKIFKMLKFRTMTNARDKSGELLPDDKRLTKYGRFLRSSSLDELPEIFNIFIGKMSIIGPRPLLVQYLPLYNERQRKRHRVRPGLTGLAQVSGRNAISWQERFNKDIEYVESVSFLGDLKIFFKTIIKVFKCDGISQAGNATMQVFRGNFSLAIYCAGGLGKEVYDLAVRSCKSSYDEIFFVDDMCFDNSFYGARVFKFDDLNASNKAAQIEFVIASGEPFIRQKLMERVCGGGFNLVTIIDETAVISPSATVGAGTLINANSFVSSNAILSDNVYIQQLSTVGHDVVVGSHSVISSLCQISGRCKLGDCVYIGVGSSVRENVSIGTGTIVGMGSFAHNDMPEYIVAYGNPAIERRKNDKEKVFKAR